MLTLDEIETRLQTLLEVHLLNYLPSYKAENRIYQHLAAAMHNNLKEQEGTTFAPNVYVIIAHPSTLARWHIESRMVRGFLGALQTAGEEAGFLFLTNPTVSPAADTNITGDEIHIIASFSNESVAETQRMPIKPQVFAPADFIPPNAFVILGGEKNIPLNHPVINIGRRLDNQEVIDDPRASRAHAQLRVAKGHYVHFVMNSSGGTFINGEQIYKSVLYLGDVISLASATLIFGQEMPTGRSTLKVTTELKSTIPVDHQTAVIFQTENINKNKAKKRRSDRSSSLPWGSCWLSACMRFWDGSLLTFSATLNKRGAPGITQSSTHQSDHSPWRSSSAVATFRPVGSYHRSRPCM